jgi:hypothetical protein
VPFPSGTDFPPDHPLDVVNVFLRPTHTHTIVTALLKIKNTKYHFSKKWEKNWYPIEFEPKRPTSLNFVC